MFIDIKYVSQHGTGPKADFYVKNMDLFSRLILEYPVMLTVNDNFGYFTSKRTTNYDEYAINDSAHAHAMNICRKEILSSKGIENFTKKLAYLYVLPTAMYLDTLPFDYRCKSEVWPESIQSKNKIGLYCPW